MVVLGISPSTRKLGLACIDGGELIKWQTVPYSQKWNQHKSRRMIAKIAELVNTYGIHAIAVKVPDDLPIARGFVELIGAINVFCEQRNYRPIYYSLSDIKKQIAPKEKINKAMLMFYISELYPELTKVYEREKLLKNPYYEKTLEAVAVAHCLYHTTSPN
ncbi:MAG: hypothetical protein H6551_09990 [Chitinophagales bacterium]|nr:hypothetical protein [Chitinophagales bacterium]